MAPFFLLNGDMEIGDAADENELMAQASDMILTCIAVYKSFGETIGNRRRAEAVAGHEETGGVSTDWTSIT